jgi:hypothetical protein
MISFLQPENCWKGLMSILLRNKGQPAAEPQFRFTFLITVLLQRYKLAGSGKNGSFSAFKLTLHEPWA